MLVFFLSLLVTDGGSPGSVMVGLLTIASVTLSIQILAPHGRIVSPQPSVKDEQGIQEHDENNEAPLSETRLDDEPFILKEEI